MKHTKEPWKTYEGNTHEIFANDGDVIASSEDCHVGHNEAAANAQRIVACVNACAEITNEVLEAGIIKKALIAYLGTYDKDVKLNNVKVWEDV